RAMRAGRGEHDEEARRVFRQAPRVECAPGPVKFSRRGSAVAAWNRLVYRASEGAEPRRVSIIVPCHNGARFLAEALDSALAQTHPAVEVIVVDDGSIDDTPSVLGRYAGRVRVIRQRNRGPSAARNAALDVARGDYGAFLDADHRFLPDKVARQAGVLDARPDVGLVYCGRAVSGGDGRALPGAGGPGGGGD